MVVIIIIVGVHSPYILIAGSARIVRCVDIAAMIILTSSITATATDVIDGDITEGRNPTLDQLDRPDTCEAETQRSPAKSQLERDESAELTILSGTTLLAFAVSGGCSQLENSTSKSAAFRQARSQR